MPVDWLQNISQLVLFHPSAKWTTPTKAIVILLCRPVWFRCGATNSRSEKRTAVLLNSKMTSSINGSVKGGVKSPTSSTKFDIQIYNWNRPYNWRYDYSQNIILTVSLQQYCYIANAKYYQWSNTIIALSGLQAGRFRVIRGMIRLTDTDPELVNMWYW